MAGCIASLRLAHAAIGYLLSVTASKQPNSTAGSAGFMATRSSLDESCLRHEVTGLEQGFEGITPRFHAVLLSYLRCNFSGSLRVTWIFK